MKRILLILFIAALVVAYFAFDLGRWLTLDALKASRDGLAALYETAPLAVIGVYFLIYVAVTALSLPGAVVMTLAGGALFLSTRRFKRELQPRDGFLLVTLVWTVLPVFAALPVDGEEEEPVQHPDLARMARRAP